MVVVEAIVCERGADEEDNREEEEEEGVEEDPQERYIIM